MANGNGDIGGRGTGRTMFGGTMYGELLRKLLTFKVMLNLLHMVAMFELMELVTSLTEAATLAIWQEILLNGIEANGGGQGLHVMFTDGIPPWETLTILLANLSARSILVPSFLFQNHTII